MQDLQLERTAIRKQPGYKHGLYGTRIYRIWANMKYRCNSENCNNYMDYGGRGIEVCEEWTNNVVTFSKWSYENGYADNLSIDRIDVNGNYESSNCRWATHKEQQNNTRDNVKVNLDGKLQGLKELSEKHNLNYNTVRNRYYNGDRGLNLIRSVRNAKGVL